MYKRSFKDYFGRNRKALYMILGILLVSTLSLTIVYAALNTVLNITGNAEVSSASWDIHLANVQLNSRSATTTAPTITNSTTATFSTTLTKPGDFYEFTIDVVNNGSIDAMIDGVSKTPTLTTAQAKYLNYIVEYQNGESINTKQLVAKNSYVRLKVRVEFRKDITASDLPTTSETLNLSFTVNYVQSDGTGNNVMDNGVMKAKVLSGDYDTFGSEVCIKEECFYVLSSTTDTVTMLAKYNLYVGNIREEMSLPTPLENPTGIQSSDAVGDSGNYPVIGITPFSSDIQEGTICSDYSGSILEGYVNNYKNILESEYGVDVVEARLISYDELTNSETFACVEVDECSDKYPWIYSTSYWSGSAYGPYEIWYVDTTNFFDYMDCSIEDYFGVRPVITISKTEF